MSACSGGRPALSLSEANIRYAMENSSSNKEASLFLNVDYKTYKKYAMLYIDRESGKSLFELHKPITLLGIPKKRYTLRESLIKYTITDILKGKFPHLDSRYVKNRLLNSGHYPPVCSCCGFNERRIDGKIPLVLDYLDADRTNHREENIRILCYNCAFMLAGEWRMHRNKESWHKENFLTPADLEWGKIKMDKHTRLDSNQ
jgi:hypothetical protein